MRHPRTTSEPGAADRAALQAVTRRHFFRESAIGIGSMALASLLDERLFADAPGAPKGPLAVRPPQVPLDAPTHWRLVLLDGTWRQAHRLLHAHPGLQRLPRWPLASPPPSRYAVRKARREDQRSTLEATCLALGALEGRPAHYAPLLAAFDGWVAALMAWRNGGPGDGGTPAGSAGP